VAMNVSDRLTDGFGGCGSRAQPSAFYAARIPRGTCADLCRHSVEALHEVDVTQKRWRSVASARRCR